ncbi:MAG: hypothetical protein HYY04_03560 [Chloroflexi bacterium]|nr:hypothetical protein [Chloroflexota bacterium]
MSTGDITIVDPRIERAIVELQEMVQRKYPTATFEVSQGDDPVGTYLWATVDVDDTDHVMDVVVDRLLHLQVEERLPLHFIPVQPVERALQVLRTSRPSRSRVVSSAAW